MDEEIEMPSEYRILRWKDGDHSLHEVYLKDGKPWSYDEGGECAICYASKSRDDLNAKLSAMADAIEQAVGKPALDEETDFPGQERYDYSMLALRPELAAKLAGLK